MSHRPDCSSVTVKSTRSEADTVDCMNDPCYSLQINEVDQDHTTGDILIKAVDVNDID